MKEKVLNKKGIKAKKEEKKKKEIAYEDNGGFGGILASKLDEIVKKEKRPKTRKKTK